MPIDFHCSEFGHAKVLDSTINAYRFTTFRHFNLLKIYQDLIDKGIYEHHLHVISPDKQVSMHTASVKARLKMT